MKYLYIATVFAGALVCLLTSLLLLARRKGGERSRIILAVIVFFSVYNYIIRFIALCNGHAPELVVSAKLLLQGNFMMFCYIMYPVEVISPGWLNVRSVIKLFAPWLLLVLVYLVSVWLGVNYTTYNSLIEMLAHTHKFEVWFRLLLSLFTFSPVLFVFFIHKTRLYRNSDQVWMKKYIIAMVTNILAYLMVLMFNNPVFNIMYYYISVGCSLYIVYMELFDRLILKSAVLPDKKYDDISETINAANSPLSEEPETQCCVDQKNDILTKRLDEYMKMESAWRNPDLSLNTLAAKLYTNRTSLAQAMRENGYENYTLYINRLRVDDFVQQIESGFSDNFQDAFFVAGFRSRNTALRNFKQFTGKTPSEYFQKK